MTAPLCFSADQLTTIAGSGDAVLNLADGIAPGVFPCHNSACRFVAAGETGFRIDHVASPVSLSANLDDDESIARLLQTLREHSVRRVLCTVLRAGDSPGLLRIALDANGLQLVEVVADQSVNADDFMPDEDTDLVARRLRELGYL